jgi:chromosome segregation ATPase
MRLPMTALSLAVVLAAATCGVTAASAAETDVERLEQLIAAEPVSPSACLEMLDSVQVRAEEMVTERKMVEADVAKIGTMIQEVEAKCQAGLFKDAWTSAVALRTLVDPPAPVPQ